MIDKILKDKKLILTIIIGILAIFVIYAGIPFISAFFGALILAYIFYPFNKYLQKKFNLKKSVSAGIIIILSLTLVIFPSFFIIQNTLKQVSMLPGYIKGIGNLEEKINSFLPINIKINEERLAEQLVNTLTGSIMPFFTNIANIFAILFLLFFLLYYFLISSEKIKESIYNIIPFEEEKKIIIIEKFRVVTYSTIIGTAFIAILQGGLLALNFFLLGIPNSLFWGFIGAVLSFLPIVGPPLIWIPAAIILIFNNNLSKGIAMLIIGIIISSTDNIIRPLVNEKYGKIHPVTSIAGIYIGIAKFGIIGIFIGPMIIAYLVLFWGIYREEYIDKK